MTEAQELALASAFMLLENAFDHVLIAVRETEKVGELMQPDCEISWTGGLVSATFMAHQSLKKMDYSKHGRRPPRVSKKIMDEVMKLHSKRKT